MEQESGDLEAFEGALCSWYDLPCHLSGFSEWLLNLALFIPRLLLGISVDLVEWATEPALSILDTAIGYATGLSGAVTGIGYLLSVFEVGTGITLIFGALIARFLLRALPGVF